MSKNEYVDLHRLLAKLNYEIAITLCEITDPELIKEYQEYQEAILKVMQIMIIDGGNKQI